MTLPKLTFFSLLLFFTSCTSESEPYTVHTVDLKHVGDSLSNQAMQTLLMNVSNAMQNGGPTNAIDFCHLYAIKLTDSLSKAHGAQISRIAEMNRNPNNRASPFEINLINDMFINEIADTLLQENDKSVYYKVIKIGMPTCLKCHGVPNDDISEETMALICEKYPDDKATDFRAGDLRGAWKIVFDE